METIGIIEVDHQDLETLLVNFTDGTFAIFSVGDLVRLQPHRETAAGDVAEPGQDYEFAVVQGCPVRMVPVTL